MMTMKKILPKIKKIKEKEIPKFFFNSFLYIFLISTGILFLSNCRPASIILSPLPHHIESVEGYASIKITGEENHTRARFSFILDSSRKGKIQVSNVMGKTLFQILIDKNQSFFVLPSKRAYWRGKEKEIMSKFLGFEMSLLELESFLTGRWERRMKKNSTSKEIKKWKLFTDEQGRAVRGEKGNLCFEVKEFLNDTSIARIFYFYYYKNEYRLKIIQIDFNQPVKKDVFSLDYLKGYEQKSWAELEKLIENDS